MEYEPFIRLRLLGDLEMAQFASVAVVLTEINTATPFSRMLLDWSNLRSWNFRPLPASEAQSWLELTRFVERTAIVHPRLWYQQAAWLAALLRVKNCAVRCYWPGDDRRAAQWLCQRAERHGGRPDEIVFENGVPVQPSRSEMRRPF